MIWHIIIICKWGSVKCYVHSCRRVTPPYTFHPPSVSTCVHFPTFRVLSVLTIIAGSHSTTLINSNLKLITVRPTRLSVNGRPFNVIGTILTLETHHFSPKRDISWSQYPKDSCSWSVNSQASLFCSITRSSTNAILASCVDVMGAPVSTSPRGCTLLLI